MPESNKNQQQPGKTTVMSPVPIGATRPVPTGRRQGGPRPGDGSRRPRGAEHSRHATPRGGEPRGGARGGNGKGRSKAPLIALCALAALVLIAYVAGAVTFSARFYPNTTLCGVDVSLEGEAAAAEKVAAATGDYELEVSGNDFTWTYSSADSGAVFDADKAVRAALSRNEPLLWPARLLEAVAGTSGDSSSPSGFDADAPMDTSLLADTFDLAAFQNSLGAAVDEYNSSKSGSFDAASAYDETQGLFTVDRARSNEKLSRDTVVKYAQYALANMMETASLDDLGADAYEPLSGNITDDQIEAACEAANGLLGANVTFKLGDSDAGTLDSSVIAQWIVFDDKLTPSLNSDAVAAWAGQLAANMNTVGTQRTYTRPDGKQVTVSGGTFGWTVDQASLVQAVQDAVANKQTGEVSVPTSTQGDVYNGAGKPDWGSYIDIDLSEQWARYYDASGNLLWESGVITGNPSKGNDTPTGVYRINNKQRNITLIGQKDESGQPEYESPVQYWIPFIDNSIGLHDASWQNSANFGKAGVENSVGSHGCINTPTDKVAQLYDMVSVGLCVIVHN